METALQPVPPEQPTVRSAPPSTREAPRRHRASVSKSRHRSHSPPSKRVNKSHGRSPAKKLASVRHGGAGSPVHTSPVAHRSRRGDPDSPGRLPSHRPSMPDTFEAAQDLINLTTSPPSSVETEGSRFPSLGALLLTTSPKHGPGLHAKATHASGPPHVGSVPIAITAPFSMPVRQSR